MSVVFTLGPASESPSLMTALYQRATRFRLNVSHVTLTELEIWLHKLSQLYKQQGHSLPVILDLQGAKMRIGKYPTGTLYAQKVTLFLGQESNNPKYIPVPHASFF
jgi:pyruvate kinase